MPDKKIRFDDYVLDYARYQLSRNGNPLKLEGLPLQLLMFLAENQGQLVTREQIADALWGKDVFVDIEQGINTAIRKVRRVLEDDRGDPQYLQTVVGKGYRFIARMQVVQGDEANSSAPAHAISAEDLGRAIMAAAGLDPEKPPAPLKIPDKA